MEGGIWLIVFIVFLVGVVVLFYYSPSFSAKVSAAAIGPYPLNGVPVKIIEPENTSMFTAGSGGSFSAFVYLNPINRTATYAQAGSATAASDATGGYSICTCAGPADCTPCAHPQYKTVVNIGNILFLEVLVAPDASRQGGAMAQLVMKTRDATKTYHETFVLPPLNVQKWTYLTIAREGRRIDVYYNNEIVLSKKAQYNFDSIGTAPITSGSRGLEGQLLIANVYNYRLSTKDVSTNYAHYADSRGQPYFNDANNPVTLSDVGGLFPSYGSTLFSSALSYIPSFNLCPAGGCFSPPTIRPANPMYTWSSPYA